jgi:hypothetical protein
MNDNITSQPRPRLAARVISRAARWQRRILGRMRAGDDFARQAGWTITRTRFGGRIYRDPRFDQLSAARAAGTSHQVTPPAPGPPAASSRPYRYPAPAGCQRPGPQGGTGTEEPDDRQHP